MCKEAGIQVMLEEPIATSDRSARDNLRADLTLIDFTPHGSGPGSTFVDVSIVHPLCASHVRRERKGPGLSLAQRANDKLAKYRTESNVVVVPAVLSTSGGLDAHFVKLLASIAHHASLTKAKSKHFFLAYWKKRMAAALIRSVGATIPYAVELFLHGKYTGARMSSTLAENSVLFPSVPPSH